MIYIVIDIQTKKIIGIGSSAEKAGKYIDVTSQTIINNLGKIMKKKYYVMAMEEEKFFNKMIEKMNEV